MNIQSNWKTVGAGSRLKIDQTWDFEKEKSITGIYIEKRFLKVEDAHEVFLYLIKKSNKIIGVNGYSFLDRLMTEAKIGNELRITFIDNIYNKENNDNMDIFTVEYRSTIAS